MTLGGQESTLISSKEVGYRRKKEESPPPHEAVLPRGVSEEDILPKRYEIFTSDYDWVQSVRDSPPRTGGWYSRPSRRDINNSSCFVPRVVASESDLPEVITDHWLPILRREGLLVECPLDQFHHPSGLGPSVHLRGFAEVSSCGPLLLSQLLSNFHMVTSAS